MVGFIKGNIVETFDSSVILENNGIGYNIFVSNTTLSQIHKSKQICLYTYLNVRDDGIYLYGFATIEEKNMFLKLITINGVGPKVALGIVSGIEINNLIIAIISSDTKTLTKIKGIGKKTAERIILELRGSLEVDSVALLNDATNNGIFEAMDKDMLDAISALRSLGITQSEAVKAVKNSKQHANNIEELISLSLRNLN